jgi:tetratricopeptide (TPR) repeat protein
MRLRHWPRWEFHLSLIAAVCLVFILTSSCARKDSLSAGMKFEQRGEFARAVRAYQAQLAKTSDPTAESLLHLRIGECLWALDRPVEAFTSYQKAVESDNDNALAQLRLGQLYLASGAPDAAAELANAVLRASDKNADALALLGSAAAANGDDSMAERAFVRVLQLDSTRTNIAVALAELYNRSNEIEKARGVLAHSAKVHPGSSAPWLALGRLEEQEGQVARAESSYRRAIAAEDTADTNLRLAQFLERSARVAEAEQVLRRVDEKRPENPTALADFQFISGRESMASHYYAAAITSLPVTKNGRGGNSDDSVAQIAARMVEADLVSIRVAGSSRALLIQKARRHLDEYRSRLDLATIAILEAEIALSESDVRKAQLHAGAALSHAPDSAASHYISGVVKWKLLDRVGARARWETALDNDSNFAPARLALAAYALEDQDFTAASQYVVPVVRDEPANYQALTLFARTLLGQRAYESAKIIARRAMVVDSNSATPHLLLGAIAEAEDEISDAFLHYQQAIIIEPHSNEALEALTTLYRKGEVNHEMIRGVERVAETDPKSATLMEIAGRLYADRDFLPDARRCLARALQMDPTRQTAALRLVQLQPELSVMQTPLLSQASSVLAGLRAQDEGRIDAAVQHYESAVRNGDASGTASNNLAWIYAEQGRNLDRALQLALEARERNPRNPAVLDTIGFVYLKRREYTQAIEVLESASRAEHWERRASDDPVRNAIRQHLTEAYRNAGQTQQAEELTSPPRPVRIARR